MRTRFADFNLVETIARMQPARVFIRRRDPALRGALRAILPDGSFSFVEVAEASLLLREASAALLSWEQGQTLEITMSDRATSDEGDRDIVVGFRRPEWNPGVILVTAISRAAGGREEEYGSALVLAPGVALSLVRRTPLEDLALDELKLAG
jgi:hypothetical protein